MLSHFFLMISKRVTQSDDAKQKAELSQCETAAGGLKPIHQNMVKEQTQQQEKEAMILFWFFTWYTKFN